MATETIAAGAVASPDNWSNGFGMTKMAAVASPDDDNGSYINSTATDENVQAFTCTPVAMTSGAIVTQIDIVARVIRTDSNRPFVLGYSFTPSGGGSQSGESTGLLTSGSWKTETYSDTGLSAVWGSGLTIFIRNSTPHDMRCSTLYAVVTYTPAAGVTTSKVARARLTSKTGGLLTS